MEIFIKHILLHYKVVSQLIEIYKRTAPVLRLQYFHPSNLTDPALFITNPALFLMLTAMPLCSKIVLKYFLFRKRVYL